MAAVRSEYLSPRFSRGESTTLLTGGRWANQQFTQGDELKSV